MNDALGMRASDRDREQVVDRLRSAMEDGRLTTDEYVDRVGLAYQARTYADLALLDADLPVAVPALATDMAQPSTPPPGPISRRRPLAGLPVLLRVLWAIWLTAVSVNVAVWVLVSLPTGNLLYPWPLWVAGPYGAALLAISAVVKLSRKPSKP
jgi:Domain of unknown function (DUF1707)